MAPHPEDSSGLPTLNPVKEIEFSGLFSSIIREAKNENVYGKPVIFPLSGSKRSLPVLVQKNRKSDVQRITRALFDVVTETKVPCIRFEKNLRMLIIQDKFDPVVVDDEGLNLLMRAVMAKNLPAIRVIFTSGVWASMRSYEVVSPGQRPEIAGKDVLQLVQTVVKSKKVLMEIKKCDAQEESLGSLHIAARAGDKKEVEAILTNITKSHVEIRKRDDQGNSVLHYACMNECVSIVEALIQAGANIKAVNKEEQTILHTATQHGNHNVVRFLLKRKEVQVTDKDITGKTPLVYTAENGDVRMLNLLLHYGAQREDSILGTAAQKGCLAYVQHLVEKLRMDLTLIDNNKKTVLHHACTHGQYHIIKYVLEKLSTNKIPSILIKRDKSGRNVLHICCESDADQTATLRLLLTTAKDHVVLKKMLDERDYYTGCSSCVLVSGKDKGRPAFHYVETKRPLVSIFEKKVKSGLVDVAQYGTVLKSGWGEHPSPEMASEVEKSLLARIDASTNPQLDWTPLHAAIYKQKEELVDMLLEFGADVNTQDCQGLTPFHLAAMRGNLKMVKKLENAGADPAKTDLQGLTPVDLAKENEHLNVVHYVKGKEQYTVAVNFVRDLEKKIQALQKAELEKLRGHGKDVRRHLINALRDMQIDVNIALMSIGSSPIMEETMD